MKDEGKHFNELPAEKQKQILVQVSKHNPELLVKLVRDDLIVGMREDEVTSYTEQSLNFTPKRLGRYLLCVQARRENQTAVAFATTDVVSGDNQPDVVSGDNQPDVVSGDNQPDVVSGDNQPDVVSGDKIFKGQTSRFSLDKFFEFFERVESVGKVWDFVARFW